MNVAASPNVAASLVVDEKSGPATAMLAAVVVSLVSANLVSSLIVGSASGICFIWGRAV